MKSPHRESEILVRAEGVSKKFCRDLKQSLWYGVCDCVAELNPFGNATGATNKFCQSLNAEDSNICDTDCARKHSLRPGEFWANHNISFELRRGECLGLIGRNGAGKTTLLKMLNGLIKPDAGKITMRGRVGALIALGAGFNPILTGRENIYVNAAILGITKRAVDSKLEEIIDFADIDGFVDSPLQSYSSGMQARLGFAVASALEPDILLVDEVLAVGDVPFRMKCYDKILKLKKDGASIILVSHNTLDLRRVCDIGVVMRGGEVVNVSNLRGALAAYESGLGQECRPFGVSTKPTSIKSLSVHTSTKDSNGIPLVPKSNTIDVELVIVSEDDIDNPRLVIFLEHVEKGILGSFSSATGGGISKFQKGENIIKFTIERMPLLEGYYSLSAAAYGPQINEFLDQKNGLAGFRIMEPQTNDFGYGSSGIVQLSANWDAK